MCPHGRAHWLQLANTIEPPVCGGDAVLCHIVIFGHAHLDISQIARRFEPNSVLWAFHTIQPSSYKLFHSRIFVNFVYDARYLKSQREIRTSCTLSMKHCLSRTVCFMCGRRRGNYLVSLYLLVKLLHLVNVVGQLFVLNAFLGQSFHLYGIDVLSSLASGDDWTNSPRFPRVTMCNFKVRRLGNVQRYTVQCVLPINLFNEKIFLFVWFWMAFVAAATAGSLLMWSLRVAFRVDRHRYVKKHLRLMDRLDGGEDRSRAVKFVEDYLRQDGVFVMRLVGHNTNAITVTEFVCSLWENYRRRVGSEDIASAPEKSQLGEDL